MSRYRLLAIDIDGTLVNVDDELSPPTREALMRAGAHGIQVVLATGRRYRQTVYLADPLAIDVPLITASGALIKDPIDHRTLLCETIEPALLRETLTIIDQVGYEPVVFADTYNEGFDFYLGRREVACPLLAEYVTKNITFGRVWPELVESPPEGIFTLFAVGSKTQMLALQDELHRNLPEKLSTHVLRSPRYEGFMCEVAAGGVDKWSAIRRLAAQWDIDTAAICAVGDDVNDLPMIRGAGLGVAMGNAVAEVKDAADRVAPSQSDDGLVEVVRWIVDGE